MSARDGSYSHTKPEPMVNSLKNEVVLPSNRAFVLQFRQGDDGSGGCYAGRIEHIESGRVDFFYSTEEMCAMLKAILNQGNTDHGK